MVPSLELRSDPASPGKARGFVRRLLAKWGIEAEVADDAELLVTELVTNAVIHARTSVKLEVHEAEGMVEFAVSDGSTRQVQLRVPAADAVTGRGIHLLDQIAMDWEVVPTAGGKTIRFRLPTHAGARVSR